MLRFTLDKELATNTNCVRLIAHGVTADNEEYSVRNCLSLFHPPLKVPCYGAGAMGVIEFLPVTKLVIFYVYTTSTPNHSVGVGQYLHVRVSQYLY